jgi:hypothetical protein
MRLPMIPLTLPAVALMIAFAPASQAATGSSPAFRAQVDKPVHVIAQKQKKASAKKPKSTPQGR